MCHIYLLGSHVLMFVALNPLFVSFSQLHVNSLYFLVSPASPVHSLSVVIWASSLDIYIFVHVRSISYRYSISDRMREGGTQIRETHGPWWKVEGEWAAVIRSSIQN